MRSLEGASGFPEANRLGQSAFVVRFHKRAVGEHAAENPMLALAGALQVQHWVKARGSLGKTGEEGGFSCAEVRRSFSKVKTGGRGDASIETAVIDSVQVFVQDAFFRPDLLEAHGLQDF